MALLEPITGTPLADIRSSANYRAIQFLCLVPNDVVVRFQPSVAPTTAVYAEITVGTVGTGSMSNIREGQTVIYSTTTDHQASEVFRGRVRKVSGTAILYIGEVSQVLTTSMYVTVIDTYELREKLRRSATLMDWEITFRKLLPIETALPSAVVISNGATSYTPTAVPLAMDDSATSSFTHLWESSNGSDSISNETTASPTFTLQAAAFRWIRYTFTDSGGRTNYRVIPCWSVPKNYSSQVVTGFVSANGDMASISHDAELGWSATIPAFTGIENVLNKTLCVIASDEWYNNSRQSIRTNINMVGWLQNESTSTSGSDIIGRETETSFTIEGIGHQLARLNVSSATVIQTNGTPTAFDRIQNPTPARMLTYHLTENTTLFNLCSMSIPADDTDFVGDDYTISNGKALDDMRAMTEVINAELQFDTDGRLDLCRNLVFLDDTARDAADTVVEFSQGDFTNHSIEYDYSKQTASLKMTGGAYNSAADTYILYEADAPAVARESEGDPQQISNQVLTTDSTGEEAEAEIAQRAANFFAANNPTWTLRCVLNDEWWFLVPDVGAWFTFPLAETDTARGKVFSSGDRWQLLQIGHSTNNITGRRQVDATFRLETQSTGAMVRASQIQNDVAADTIYYPAVLPPFVGESLEYTDGNWYDSEDSAPPSDQNPVPGECELGGLRIKSGNTYTTQSWLTLYVSSMVRGSGRIGYVGDGWCYEYDFTAGNQGFIVDPSRPFGNYVGGDGWQHEDGEHGGVYARRINIKKTGITAFTATRVEVDFSLTKGAYTMGAEQVISIRNGISTVRAALLEEDAVDGDDQTWVGDGGGFSEIYVTANSSTDLEENYSGAITLHRIRFFGAGTNPFGVDNCTPGEDDVEILGDAFYYSDDDWETAQAYDAGEGLLIEGVQPSGIPPYTPSHEYALPLILITGLATVSYEFNSPYDLAQAENFSLQLITCPVEDA